MRFRYSAICIAALLNPAFAAAQELPSEDNSLEITETEFEQPKIDVMDEIPTEIEIQTADISSNASAPMQIHPQVLTQEELTACEESIIYPNAIMRRAETAYTKRHYQTVIDTLKPIYENLQCVDSPDTVIEVYLLLAVSHLELGNASMADTFFLDVLRTDPDYDPLGAIIILPGESTQRIEQLRAEHASELDSLRNEASHSSVVETLFVPGEIEQRPYWINFLPFGAGTFQMHKPVWGSIYASTQLAGILLSILGGSMVEYYRGDNYKFTSDNYKYAKNWQISQIIGIALLGTSYLASVIHALVIHEPAPIIWQSPTKTPPTHAAAPLILPDGAGIAYEARF